MMKKLVAISLVFWPLLSSAQMKEFGWLLGKWKVKDKNAYEVWKAGSDQKMLEGKAYRVKGADTVVSETIKLRYEGDHFYYIPDLAGDQPEIPFKITQNNNTGFVAENPKHDFPKIIRYILVSPVSIKATVEGDGKVIAYYFEKVN